MKNLFSKNLLTTSILLLSFLYAAHSQDLSKNISSEFNTMPKPTGPYQIGVKIYDLTDATRENRLIPIWIYFPIEKGPQVTYPKVWEKRGLDLWDTNSKWAKLNIHVYTKWIDNLDFLKKDSKHPVIFFTNGNGMLCSDAAFLIEDLASHGYIVVSIQHQLERDKKTESGLAKYSLVIDNMRFVFDWFKKNNKTEFYDALNLNHIGCIGYSMGANAMVLFASGDYGNPSATLFPHDTKDRVKECIIAIDPQAYPFPYNNIHPTFLLFAAKREEEQKKSGEYDFMKRSGHKFIYYKDASHASFSDLAYLNVKCPGAPTMGWYSGSSEERMRFFNGIRKDIRTFLQEHLKIEKTRFSKSYPFEEFPKHVEDLKNFSKNESLLASLILIVMYTEGIGVEKDISTAEQLMLKTSAFMNQMENKDKIKRYWQEFELLKEMVQNCQKENPLLGIYEGILGYMYLRGWGTEQNDTYAFQYIQQSAVKGLLLSIADLGKMYQDGKGVKQDYSMAYNLYHLAAEQGLSAANYRLGQMYEKGLGVEKNTKKADEFYKKAGLINK